MGLARLAGDWNREYLTRQALSVTNLTLRDERLTIEPPIFYMLSQETIAGARRECLTKERQAPPIRRVSIDEALTAIVEPDKETYRTS